MEVIQHPYSSVLTEMVKSHPSQTYTELNYKLCQKGSFNSNLKGRE